MFSDGSLLASEIAPYHPDAHRRTHARASQCADATGADVTLYGRELCPPVAAEQPRVVPPESTITCPFYYASPFRDTSSKFLRKSSTAPALHTRQALEKQLRRMEARAGQNASVEPARPLHASQQQAAKSASRIPSQRASQSAPQPASQPASLHASQHALQHESQSASLLNGCSGVWHLPQPKPAAAHLPRHANRATTRNPDVNGSRMGLFTGQPDGIEQQLMLMQLVPKRQQSPLRKCALPTGDKIDSRAPMLPLLEGGAGVLISPSNLYPDLPFAARGRGKPKPMPVKNSVGADYRGFWAFPHTP